MKRAKSRYGFTLVELIVVIAILGILAGIGAVAYRGYVRHANRAADDLLVEELNRAFATALNENGLQYANIADADISVIDQVIGNNVAVDWDGSFKDAQTAAALIILQGRLQNSFKSYFIESEERILKFYTSVSYNSDLHQFEGSEQSYLQKVFASSNFSGRYKQLLEQFDNISYVLSNGQFSGLVGMLNSNEQLMLMKLLEMAPGAREEFYKSNHIDDPSAYEANIDLLNAIEALHTDKTDYFTAEWFNNHKELLSGFVDEGTLSYIYENINEDDINKNGVILNFLAKMKEETADQYEKVKQGKQLYDAIKSIGLIDYADFVKGSEGAALGNNSVFFIAEKASTMDLDVAVDELETVSAELGNLNLSNLGALLTKFGTPSEGALPISYNDTTLYLPKSTVDALGGETDMLSKIALGYSLATGYYYSDYYQYDSDDPEVIAQRKADYKEAHPDMQAGAFAKDTPEGGGSIFGMLGYMSQALNDKNFKAYYANEGKSDLQAYQAAMSALNDNKGIVKTENQGAFSDEKVVGRVGELLGG